MKKPFGKTQNSSSKKRKTFAKKSFGQNFLVNEIYINKIVSRLNPQPGETIIEIGAGRGALTEKIIGAKADIIAVELERDMIEVLRERFGSDKNFELIEADVLKIDFENLLAARNIQPPIKLAANLPYYISTAVLQKIIEKRHLFSEMILMFQREVVDRITAAAGSSERGFLTVLVEAYLDVDKLFDVPPAAFRPSPKVWSSVARLTPKKHQKAIENNKLFRNLIAVGFGQKRKTILNNLKKLDEEIFKRIERYGGLSEILSAVNIESSRRAESLTFEEWSALTEKLDDI